MGILSTFDPEWSPTPLWRRLLLGESAWRTWCCGTWFTDDHYGHHWLLEHVPSDRLYLDLKGVRERLCRAQTSLDSPAHRQQLQEAIDVVDRVGAFACPQWSTFDVPDLPEDG